MSLSVAEEREAALEVARWAGRRLATCEAHYFAAAVAHGRAGHERARVLRERWRRLAIEFGAMFEGEGAELARLGMLHAARLLAEEAGERIGKARAALIREHGLDPAIAGQVPLACLDVSGPPGWHRPEAN